MCSVLVLLVVGLVPCGEPVQVTTPTPALPNAPMARTVTRRRTVAAFMQATEQLRLWNDQPANRPGFRRGWILEELGKR